MSLSVKEILNIGRRQLEESDIADAAVDCKLLYCYLMNISSAQLILEYQKCFPTACAMNTSAFWIAAARACLCSTSPGVRNSWDWISSSTSTY